MGLKEELELARKEIKTDGYPISIRELVSLYRDGELDIHPEFQRFLRWSQEQKTKLVESLLLGIPLPSIFVSQRNDGVLDVVDGLQRISTILQFMGELKDENGNLLKPLQMGSAQYLPSIENKFWKPHNSAEGIGDDIQKFFRQEKLDIKILLRESDEQAKYELFQRINSGGTPLSDQEVRNCILIMINRSAYFWLEQQAKYIPFTTCCPLPERLSLERYDLELILRFSILYNIDISEVIEIGDLSQFLTNEMRTKLIVDQSYLEVIASNFERVFSALEEACGDNALRKFESSKNKFSGPFLISAFELVALGVSHNIDFVENQGKSWLRQKIEVIWSDPSTIGIYGQGVSTARRLPRTLEVGRAFFAKA